jgi:hypothetical protein
MELNGAAPATPATERDSNRGSSQKRKHSGSPANAKDLRPSKHMRESDFSDDEDSEIDMMDDTTAADPNNDLTYNDLPLGMMEPERMLPAAAAAVAAVADSAEWQRTIESVVRNVVSIRFCQTCSFDTDSAVTSEATGFVVDAERGYILTNRHVVCAGPFWGYCVFDNHEEVRVLTLSARSSWTPTQLTRRSAMCIPSIETPSTISVSCALTRRTSNTCPLRR